MQHTHNPTQTCYLTPVNCELALLPHHSSTHIKGLTTGVPRSELDKVEYNDFYVQP